MNDFLATQKWQFIKKAQRLLSKVISKLPRLAQLRIRDDIKLTGKLDYPKKDLSMIVDSKIQLWRLKACKNEPETPAWIEKYMRSGEVFYDIGANVGAYSLVASAVGGTHAAVYAFEPSFSTFDALSKNILLNNLQGTIIPIQIALSDTSEIMPLIYADTVPGSSTHSLQKSPRADAIFQPTISYKLDDFIDQFKIKSPNHIKIDVDGGELNVISGAAKTLRDSRLKSLLIEIDEKLESNKKVLDLIKSAGFKVAEKHPKKVRLHIIIFLRNLSNKYSRNENFSLTKPN